MVGSSLAGVIGGRGLGERKKREGGYDNVTTQGEVLCPAVLVKRRVCGVCSVSWAHEAFLRSILFFICLSFSLSPPPPPPPAPLPFLRLPRSLGGSGLRISLI